MDASAWLILWGSPVGLAVFFAGLGVLLWGVGKNRLSEVAKAELELKERQHFHERTQGKEGAGSSTT
jgi:hypothetical protein